MRGARGAIQAEEETDHSGDSDAERDDQRSQPRRQRRDRRDDLTNSGAKPDARNAAALSTASTDSVNYLPHMSVRRAPSALRSPISRVRSVTTTA